MKLPDAEPGPCWTSSGLSKKKLWETSHQILKVFLAFQSFFVLDLSWFFKFLYSSLNTTSWVSSLFADLPFESGLADAKLWFYVCQILWSLAFWIEWCDWKLVLYKLYQASNAVKLHTTCVCNAQACLAQTWCNRPFSQQSFWHEIVGQIQVLAMTLIRVPFHLGLREPGSCYCSSVRGGPHLNTCHFNL